MGSETFIQGVLNGFMAGWIYVLVSLGLTLVLSILGIFQLAHGEVYMLGAYVAYYAAVRMGLGFYPALFASILLVGAFGILLERTFFRPFRDNPERAMIVTLALVLVLQTVAVLSFGGTTKVNPSPFKDVLTIFGVTLSVERLVVILIGIALVAALFLFINLTKTGQAMIAVSQDRDAAALQGIDINRMSAVGMFLGCALAAAAGALVGSIFSLSPTMGGFALTKGIAVIILGGLGSLGGTIISGLLLGLIDGLIPSFLSVQTASIIGFALVIITLIVRPQGLMGHE